MELTKVTLGPDPPRLDKVKVYKHTSNRVIVSMNDVETNVS